MLTYIYIWRNNCWLGSSGKVKQMGLSAEQGARRDCINMYPWYHILRFLRLSYGINQKHVNHRFQLFTYWQFSPAALVLSLSKFCISWKSSRLLFSSNVTMKVRATFSFLISGLGNWCTDAIRNSWVQGDLFDKRMGPFPIFILLNER